MALPDRLSVVPSSPYYDKQAIARVDKVFVDGIHLPFCLVYDIPGGWAKNKLNGVWQPRKYGVISVTEKDPKDVVGEDSTRSV